MQNMREKLRAIAKKFPNSPGVYFWRDEKGTPLYIGRAGSLKKRVASYFLAKDSRIREMVEKAYSVDYQDAETVLEAIVREANLIKKHWPKYNVEGKDNRSFVYLVILKGTYPKPIIVRGRELEQYLPSKSTDQERREGKIGSAEIFGPYTSYRLLRMVLEMIRPIFPFSTCSPVEGPRVPKPCFHYQIGLCPGVCVDKVAAKEYQSSIRNLILFMKGEKKLLLKKLKKEQTADPLGFDKVKALAQVQDTALLSQEDSIFRSGAEVASQRIEGYDISHSKGKEPVGAMVVFENAQKNTDEYRLFKIYRSNPEDDLAMLQEVLERRLKHTEWPMPDIVFIDGGVNQVRRAVNVLSTHHVNVPVVGLGKGGKHAGSAYATDKLVIANSKKVGKELIVASKKLFQEVRNEAHRFAIGFQRRRTKKSFLSKGWISKER